MKTLQKLFILISACLFTINAQSQVRFQMFQIEFQKDGQYAPIYFGKGWATEFVDNGLNIWKPSNSSNPGNYKFFIDNRYPAKYGIGKKPTTYTLEVAGDVMIQGDLHTVHLVNTRSMQDLSSNDCLNKITDLKPKSYKKRIIPSISNIDEEIQQLKLYGKIQEEDVSKVRKQLTEEKQVIHNRTEYGFLAQDLKEIFPDLVEEGKDGYLSVNYLGLIPVLMESIKELQKKIDKQSEAIKIAKDISLTKNK